MIGTMNIAGERDLGETVERGTCRARRMWKVGRVGRLAVVGAVLLALGAACSQIADPKLARAAAIAGVCLVLWLSEVIPLYATTLLLWVAIVLFMRPIDPAVFSTARVLAPVSNPVMALFFGGFALSVAAGKYGIDAYIAGWIVRLSGGRRLLLLGAVMAGTAVMSMWMSNIAAAAMMIATLRPLLAGNAHDAAFRKAMLLGVAFAANFGGIATPIGTGPNLIAIGAVADQHRITFLHWMLFGVPLASLMLAVAYAVLAGMHRVRGRVESQPGVHRPLSRHGWFVVAIFFASVLAWLTEPLHGVPSAVIAVAAAGTLFATQLLRHTDLAKIDWGTLLLIAGGLTLGQLFDDSGLARSLAAAIRWDVMPPVVLTFCLVLACATIAAVASNTGASAVLIQIALGVVPTPAVAVLVALGASMGVPFVISTPPNAMAYGQGGLHSRDFFWPGLVLMLTGCALLAVLGPAGLRWAGVP